MGTAAWLDDLSFESDDTLLADPEGHFDGSIKNPMIRKEFIDCDTVIETYNGVVGRGYITMQDAARLHDVKDGFPHLDRFFRKYPLKSFTTDPSMINYEVSVENFIVTIGKAIVAALKATIQWIIDKTTALWKWVTSTRAQSEKVESLSPNLLAIQDYLANVIPRIQASSQLSATFEPLYKRAIDTQRHNLNRGWNALYHAIQKNESLYYNHLTQYCRILEGSVPDYIKDTRKFMELLQQAKTENDVIEAIRLNTLQRGVVDTNEITKTALAFGYSPRTPRKQGVTSWQAMCQVVVGHYRAMSNDRKVDVTEQEFLPMVANTKLSRWADVVRSTEKRLSNDIPNLIKELKAFDASKMNPGLEHAYRTHLFNYMPMLISTLQGFSHLQEVVTLMIGSRDRSSFAISKAGLELVKVADKFIEDNYDKLQLSDQVIRKKYKQAIGTAFR